MVYLSITDVEHGLLSPCRVLEVHNYAHGSLFFVSEEGQESLQRCLPVFGPRLPKGLTLLLLRTNSWALPLPPEKARLPCPRACQICFQGAGTRAALFPSMSGQHVASGKQHGTTEDLRELTGPLTLCSWTQGVTWYTQLWKILWMCNTFHN